MLVKSQVTAAADLDARNDDKLSEAELAEIGTQLASSAGLVGTVMSIEAHKSTCSNRPRCILQVRLPFIGDFTSLFLRYGMQRAGIPIANELGGTSDVTTALAPTVLPSPMVSVPALQHTFAPVDIFTRSPIMIRIGGPSGPSCPPPISTWL
jgi:hypothetical protein